MDAKYEVPVIPHNLRREETVVQIAEALNYLADVSTDIFKRINDRIAQNKKQVDAITQRINNASTKLDKLAGAKKATLVFSSSKYPAEHVNQKYKSVFNDSKQILPIERFDYNYKSSQVSDEPQEALQFYYVNLKQKKQRGNFSGLGSMPNDIETINDLLLFNTGKNPYDKDSSHDKSNTSVTSANKKAEKNANDDVDIGAAPFSLTQGINVRQNPGENYFYSPDLGNVPTIDVPLDLPDLEGIADDLRYNIEREPTIAPSISSTFSSVIPDLPDIDDTPATTTNGNQEDNVNPIETSIKVQEATNANQTQISVNNQNVNEEIVDHRQVEVTAPITEPVVNTVRETTKPTVVPAADNSRANLMEAIRNAGGPKSLKSKSAQPAPKKEVAPTGDLMADLHAKLSMRRKGIQGNKQEDPTVVDKLSAMIPPPPTQSDVSESTEDEWDD